MESTGVDSHSIHRQLCLLVSLRSFFIPVSYLCSLSVETFVGSDKEAQVRDHHEAETCSRSSFDRQRQSQLAILIALARFAV